MTPSFRQIAVALLAGLVAIGHAPAWLHVADCEHHESHFSVAEIFSTGCHHGCHHDHVNEAEDAQQDSESHDKHDSGSCAICQSLASANGVVWQLEADLRSELCFETKRISVSLNIESTSLSIPQPRGPPTLV